MSLQFFTRRLTSLLLVILATTPALAQNACTPEKLNAAIDTYANEPFGARSWRMLNGLRDPGLSPESMAYSSWSVGDDWRKTVTAIAPDMPELANTPYDCRMTYPLETLKMRANTFGSTHPYVKQWLRAQARVLKACDNPTPGDDLTLPPPMDATAEFAQQQEFDRAYQEASIAFYRDKPRAIIMFRAIAQTASPHRATARYNIANLFAAANNVVEARKEIAGILADQSVASVHTITRELSGFVSNQEDTAEGWTSLIDQTIATLQQPLENIEAAPAAAKEFSSALYDIGYAGIRNKRDDWWILGTLPQDATLSKSVVDASRKHPIALWMMTGQSISEKYDSAPWPLIGAKWNAWAQSYATRAMALQPAANGISDLPRSMIASLTSANDAASRQALWAKAKAALIAAQSTCGTAPETAAVSELWLHATRLAATANNYDEIYAAFKALPIQSSQTYYNRILPKLMQHVLAKGDVGQGRRLRDELLTPAFFAGLPAENREYHMLAFSEFMSWVAEDETKWLAAQALNVNKSQATVLNLQTTKTLRRLSENPIYSAEQKALLSRAAWTREYAQGLTPKPADTDQMLLLNPDVKAGFDAVKVQYPKLNSDQIWLLTILRNPRFGILINAPGWSEPIEAKRTVPTELDPYDHNDKNWWCPLETDRQLQTLREIYDQSSGLNAVTDYRSDALKLVIDEADVAAAITARDQLLKNHPMVKAIDWRQVKRLASAPSAPKQLTKAALRLAATNKSGDGPPEALALAVRATRYGCNWHGGHKAYSKPAQELLKSRYAATQWFTQTPYWFDCMSNKWDDKGNRVATCEAQKWPKQAPLQ